MTRRTGAGICLLAIIFTPMGPRARASENCSKLNGTYIVESCKNESGTVPGWQLNIGKTMRYDHVILRAIGCEGLKMRLAKRQTAFYEYLTYGTLQGHDLNSGWDGESYVWRVRQDIGGDELNAVMDNSFFALLVPSKSDTGFKFSSQDEKHVVLEQWYRVYSKLGFWKTTAYSCNLVKMN